MTDGRPQLTRHPSNGFNVSNASTQSTDVAFDVLHQGEVQIPFTSHENSRVDPSTAQDPVMLRIGSRPEERVAVLFEKLHDRATVIELGETHGGTAIPSRC